ncbi:hypothetical protein CDEST_10486 [Colletotrichum destructivum]|uniref:Uncharacterized protein n=1 Tax=Colletotrichum destructivum TaxID=34406 RepID=A0AAX4IQ82_9PEZI|nr:hypothetical protein CDEST_10486 [Colletotrichum destructivum]
MPLILVVIFRAVDFLSKTITYTTEFLSCPILQTRVWIPSTLTFFGMLLEEFESPELIETLVLGFPNPEAKVWRASVASASAFSAPGEGSTKKTKWLLPLLYLSRST